MTDRDLETSSTRISWGDRRSGLDSRLRGMLLEAIVSATPDLVYAFDLEHRFIFANEALLAMWGKTWTEAIGKNCLELGYEPWHAQMHDSEIDEVVKHRRPVRGEVPFIGTNGRRIYDYIFVPVLNESGAVEAIAGTTRDITERRQQEQHRALLTNELQHRVKNTLAVVQAIARQSFGAETAYGDFAVRLKALANGLDVLTQDSWASARLQKLVDGVLAMHQPAASPRIQISGPDLVVRPRSVVALSLALGELATNAVKYGSLSNAEGMVDVGWKLERDRFVLIWSEHGGPAVQAPSRTGFGSRLIKNLASELSADVSLEYLAQGVVCKIEASRDVVMESSDT